MLGYNSLDYTIVCNKEEASNITKFIHMFVDHPDAKRLKSTIEDLLECLQPNVEGVFNSNKLNQ